MKQQIMDLNRETAMRLWNKSFGKESKVTDFAGRMIAKGALMTAIANLGGMLTTFFLKVKAE